MPTRMTMTHNPSAQALIDQQYTLVAVTGLRYAAKSRAIHQTVAVGFENAFVTPTAVAHRQPSGDVLVQIPQHGLHIRQKAMCCRASRFFASSSRGPRQTADTPPPAIPGHPGSVQESAKASAASFCHDRPPRPAPTKNPRQHGIPRPLDMFRRNGNRDDQHFTPPAAHQAP